jgi:maltooligosyltrehalose trehalohydrolase
MDLISSSPQKPSPSPSPSPSRSSQGSSPSVSPQSRYDAASLPLLGAQVDRQRGLTRFGLYATTTDRCAVRLYAADGTPGPVYPMSRLDGGSEAKASAQTDDHSVEDTHAGLTGYFQIDVPGVGPGTLYKMVLDGRELPDPYARYLPSGVNGPAMVVDPAYSWHGPALGKSLAEQVIYELHVGTFSPAGTYAGVRERLPELVALGITAVELMPLAAFAGSRGWGYDGVALYAPFAPYGTPDELRALIDEAHSLGLSVFLDAVYNHFGPAGNYLTAYSPNYFTAEIRNAWGDAPNYAHPLMRRLVIENALYWLEQFRFDGLRLDAVHAILDPSPRHILRDLTTAVAALAPRRLLIAEDDRNDPASVTEIGLDAVWADDFHHAVRVTLTRERDGYYAAYQPGAANIAQAIQRGWLYEGQPYPPTGKPRGKPAGELDMASFVYCIQNHDQVGNRAFGDRLAACVSPEQYRAVSTLLLFLPMTPLIFMGQEWGARSPFMFFTDHDPELGRAIFEGRREEFKHFQCFADPVIRAAIPDPQDPATFEASRLCWEERERHEHAALLALYQAMLALRRNDPVLKVASREGVAARAVDDVLLVTRAIGAQARTLMVNFGDRPVSLETLGVIGDGSRVLFRSDRAADPQADRSGGPQESSGDTRPEVAGVPPGELPPHTAIVIATDAPDESRHG